MTEGQYVVLSARHIEGTRNTEVTVGTPDLRQATVTIPDSLVGSHLADEVIRRAMAVRDESTEALRPVDE